MMADIWLDNEMQNMDCLERCVLTPKKVNARHASLRADRKSVV